MKNLSAIIIFSLFLICSCNQKFDEPVGSGGWLTGDVNEKFETVTEHLGGFGKAMWEVDYRFQELFWAGADRNWEYSEHQIDEMEEALELGLERRPARAASAGQFMTSAIPGVIEAIENRDSEMFESRINLMINTCNSCHALEDVAFITVKPPVTRRSTVR